MYQRHKIWKQDGNCGRGGIGLSKTDDTDDISFGRHPPIRAIH